MYKTFRKIDKPFVSAYRNFVKEILNKFIMNNTVFITGASSGLGKATARLFQQNGWNVIAAMRSPENEN